MPFSWSDFADALDAHFPEIIAGAIVALYAWQRYGTPKSNRCSTTRAQFYFTCAAYVVCALAIYGVITKALGIPGALAFLTFGGVVPDQVRTYSAPFLAALLLTTLLPSIPFLQRVDEALLHVFQALGSIPVEVSLLKEKIKEEKNYVPLNATRDSAREYLDNNGILPIVARKLDFDPGKSAVQRFTRSLCLYCETTQLDKERPFFRGFPGEAAELHEAMLVTSAQAGAFFTFADSIPTVGPEESTVAKALRGTADRFVSEAEVALKKVCEEVQEKTCLLLAQGLLNASWSSSGLKQRMKNRGFENLGTRQPIVSNFVLTAALIILAIFVAGFGLLRALGLIDLSGNRQVTLAFIIAVNYGIAAMFAVMPKRLWSFAKRTADHGRCVPAYMVSALMTAPAAMIVGLIHTVAWEGNIETGMARYFAVAYPWIVPPTVGALILAYCCDSYLLEKSEPRWLRWSEGAGLGVILAALTVGVSIWFRELLLKNMPPTSGLPAGAASPLVYALVLIGIAFAVGVTLGALVPYAYRKSRRVEAG